MGKVAALPLRIYDELVDEAEDSSVISGQSCRSSSSKRKTPIGRRRQSA